MKKIYFSLLAIITFTFANAQIVNIPDANFKALLLSASSSNGIASAQSPVFDTTDSSWSISSYDSIDTNNDGEIQVTEAQVIKCLFFSSSQISNLTGIESFINLEYFSCSNTLINNLSLSQNVDLEYLFLAAAQLTNIDVTQNTNLQTMFCVSGQLTNLDVSQNINLKSLNCSQNHLTNLDLTQNINLEGLSCSGNQLTSLDVTQNTNLLGLYCDSNLLTNLNVSQNVDLKTLECFDNQLTNLDLTQNINLLTLNCSNNLLTNLNINQNILLEELKSSTNQLTTLDLTQNTNLYFLDCGLNQLTNLDVSNNPLINYISCKYNQITNLIVSQNINLAYFNCSNNQLTTLNVSANRILRDLICSSNQLESLFIKNNNVSWITLDFNFNDNISYICADEEDLTLVQQRINSYGFFCNVNSYCSFTPGGTFYTIQGNSRFDFNSNGCDVNDLNYPNLKFNITSGTNSGTLISNTSGNYSIPVSAGTHTFSPQFENPSYFTASPSTATVTFPTTASPFTQDFCITANGVHHDLETVIIPLNAARPGFDASYKIKYKNKGNQVENASLALNYDGIVLALISSSVVVNSQNFGVLNWNLGSLNPFEEGEIIVTFNLNSPMDSPPVNAGYVLDFVSNISSGNTDETPNDNSANLNQTVVNSFDPNDKTCLEGNTINSSMIGEYLHYMIRFENTGTFPAENIVVKDLIDTTKFDVSTLQMTDASHSCYTRINGNKVEFIFENINLDFNDATNDGYVVFKIKTLPTLAINAQVTNNANIYFDYNFPITTNTATSTFTTLANNSFDFDTYFTLAPIPAKDILTISNNQNASISSISIYNILGQVVFTSTNPSETIDVSSLKTGNYFIKVTSDKGISSNKFIKE